MDTWSIKTFLTLAEVKRMSTCADLLCITKSAVSSRIKQLEIQLDEALFERSSQGMQLTKAGQRFYQHAQVMQQRWEHAKADVKQSDDSAGTLRIMTHSSLAKDFLLAWGEQLKKKHPQTTIHMNADYSNVIITEVASGAADIGLIFVADATSGLIVEHIYTDQLIMVCQQPLKLSQVNSQNYLYVDWGWGYNAAHSEQLPQLTASWQQLGLGELALPWLLTNEASAYVPIRSAAAYLQAGQLYAVQDAPQFQRPIYLTYAREPTNQRLIQQALDALQDYLHCLS